MKIVWHVFLKDLRRLAGPVALLALVLAVKFIVGWQLIVGNEPTREGFERAEWFVNLFRGLELAGSYFLTLRLIGEDSVVATRTFWRTRPMAGGRLLAAKLLGLGLMLGVLPVVISVPWWIGCGLTGGQMALAVLDTLALQAAVVAPALLVAVLTDSLARALLWTLVVGAVAGTWGVMWLLISRSGGGIVGSQIIVAVGVVVAAIGLVLALQYFTRRLNAAVIAAVGGMLLTAFSSIAWPWDFSAERFPPEGGRTRGADSSLETAIVVKMGKILLQKNPAHPLDSWPEWDELRIKLTAAGVPDDLRLLRAAAEHRLRWPDGTEQRFSDQRGYNYSWSDMEKIFGVQPAAADEETNRWFEQMRAKNRSISRTLEELSPGEWNVSGGFGMRPAMVQKLREVPPAYEFLGWFALVKPELLMEIPAIRGGWKTSRGRGIRIVSSEKSSVGLSIEMVDGRFESALQRWSTIHFPGPFKQFREGASYFSVDRVHGLVGGISEPTEMPPRLSVGSVTIGLRKMAAYGPKVVREGNWTDRWPDWREKSTVAVVDFPEVARFLRTLKVERLEIQNPP